MEYIPESQSLEAEMSMRQDRTTSRKTPISTAGPTITPGMSRLRNDRSCIASGASTPVFLNANGSERMPAPTTMSRSRDQKVQSELWRKLLRCSSRFRFQELTCVAEVKDGGGQRRGGCLIVKDDFEL